MRRSAVPAEAAAAPGSDEAASAHLLARFSDRLAARLGLHFPPERRGELARALAAMAPELGGGDLRACLERLLAAPLDTRQLEILAMHLTVGESYFFRDPAAFACLEREILPGLLRGSPRPLRLWSAGCSGGEEAYSLAMVLDRRLPAARPAEILATDINPRALARAARGIYDEWSFRGVAPELKERYFRRTADGRYGIVPALRTRVRFERLNLAADPYPAGMDIVFCRNVLIYFAPERAAAAVAGLARALAPGGFLVVSPVEVPLVAAPELQPRYPPGITVFCRKAAPALLPLPAPPRAGRDEKAAGRHLPARAVPPSGQTLARTLADRGRLAEALACCERAGAAERLDPAYAYLRASILLEQGRSDAAAAALRQTLYLDHRHALAHFALGNLQAGRGWMQEARRHYRNALASLAAYPTAMPLPQADGLTAGRLRETLCTLIEASP